MVSEFMSNEYLNRFEKRAEMKADQIDASLGDIGESQEFDFCSNCPLIGKHTELDVELARKIYRIGTSPESGLRVTMQLQFSDGERSDHMLLAQVSGDTVTGKLVDHLSNNAAARTQKCQAPVRASSLLGLFGLKHCPAIDKV